MKLKDFIIRFLDRIVLVLILIIIADIGTKEK